MKSTFNEKFRDPGERSTNIRDTVPFMTKPA